ncbi:hypothetical protein [Actinomadura rubrisoli]|uniref:Methylamine utilization protein MauE n=1 Tax=Actinomadura rubrisoli TaxID=2530368 RepID=A0A4V2YT48_9ACTN|nr:hypothetical protein [Actinomadura rubrisoli]TDD72477.1 hypothetical protein E1298_35015 [Actinomadura rubrisoli]
MFSTIVAGVLAGPLAVAGAAKILTPSGRLAWPFRRGVLRPPWGPRLAGTAEVAGAAALIALPARPAAAAGLAAYAALTVTAYRLKGERCACFGPARLASVGRTHLGANAAGTALAALALAAGPGGPGLPVRAGIGAAASAATLGAVLALDRRARKAEMTAAPRPCAEAITGVRLYLTEGCPSCRALKQLLETVEPARREAVATTLIGRGEKLPEPLSGMGVPCAVGVGASGEPVCAPAEGIGAVKALVDTITVRTAPKAAAHAR